MANNYKGPMDYIDVATRIADFRQKYPNGRLRQADVKFLEFADKSWVVYTAEAWRDENDPAPAQGTAWEPVPGPTSFTRDSELQNAETAAWGRAIVAAMASDTKEGIASREEIRNRQRDEQREAQEREEARQEDLKAWADKCLALEKAGELDKLKANMQWAGKKGDRDKFHIAQGIVQRLEAATTEPQSVGDVMDAEVIEDGPAA